MARNAGRVTAIVALVLLAGCAHQRPVVYPQSGAQQSAVSVEQATNACMARARSYGLEYNGNVIAKRATRSGVVGAAGGAVAGALYGDWTRGALTGLASGVTVGLLRGLFAADRPSPVFRRFVSRCMAEHGYDVIGWQ